MKKKILIFTIVFVLLGGGIFYKTTFGSVRYEGYRRAKMLIEKKVDYPETIKYPDYFFGKSLNILKKDDKTYRYDGYVTAKNTFGTAIRYYFEIELKDKENGEYEVITWKVNEQ